MGPKLLLGIQHVGRCLRCKHGHFTSTTTANNAAMAAGSTLYLHTATEQSVSFVSCGKDRRKQNNEMPGSTFGRACKLGQSNGASVYNIACIRTTEAR